MVIVESVTLEAKQTAYHACLKSCPGPLKCKKNGLIFVENLFFPCPDFQHHKKAKAIQKELDQSIPESLKDAQIKDYQCGNETQQRLLAVANRYFMKKAWEKGMGMIITGTPGLGKTFMAVAMYKQLMQKGIQAAFARPKTQGSYQSIEKYYKQLEQPKVLIYDDMGPELRKEIIVDMLFFLFDRRLTANKGVIITTNLPINNLKYSLGPRIHSRLKEKNYFLEIKGEDYRQRKRDLY